MASSVIKAVSTAVTTTPSASTSISAKRQGCNITGHASFDAVSQGWFTRGKISPAPSTDLTFPAYATDLSLGLLRIKSNGDVQIWNGSTTMHAFYGVPFSFMV